MKPAIESTAFRIRRSAWAMAVMLLSVCSSQIAIHFEEEAPNQEEQVEIAFQPVNPNPVSDSWRPDLKTSQGHQRLSYTAFALHASPLAPVVRNFNILAPESLFYAMPLSSCSCMNARVLRI